VNKGLPETTQGRGNHGKGHSLQTPKPGKKAFY
jgi:hypothetical protein